MAIVHEIDGKKYVEIVRNAEIGDKVISSEQLDFTDRIYEVYSVYESCVLGKYSRGHTSLSHYRVLIPSDEVQAKAERQMEQAVSGLLLKNKRSEIRTIRGGERMTFKEIETVLRGALNEIKPAYVPDPEITFELGVDKERIIIEFNREHYDLNRLAE